MLTALHLFMLLCSCLTAQSGSESNYGNSDIDDANDNDNDSIDGHTPNSSTYTSRVSFGNDKAPAATRPRNNNGSGSSNYSECQCCCATPYYTHHAINALHGHDSVAVHIALTACTTLT
jgi:hypothetical protein